MRKRNLLLVLVLVLGCGLIAAGCGDDDSTTTDAITAEDTTAEEATTQEETTTKEGDDSASGSVDAEGVYDACIDAIEGTSSEDAGKSTCETARNAFEQCSTQAQDVPDEQVRETALQACEDAADKTIEGLKKVAG